MQSYRIIPVPVYRAQRRLALVLELATRDGHSTADALADRRGVSRSQLYKLQQQAVLALVPKAPGPKPARFDAERAAARIAELEAELATARALATEQQRQLQQHVAVTTRRAHALELVLTVENVSQRGIQRVFDVAFDGQHRPSTAALQARLHHAGCVARDLLTRAREQVRDTLQCVMGDDIFFAGTAVKVVAEPRSMAVLNVGRWRWHEAADWTLWLEEFGALRLFVSDLGTDLVGAIDRRGVEHCADFFHEVRWWDKVAFPPLVQAELEARQDWLAELEIATTPFSRPSAKDHARVERAAQYAAQAEAEFFAAYALYQQVRGLYQPLRATGELWTDAAVTSELASMDDTVKTITHSHGNRLRKHLRKHGRRYAAHRTLLQAIRVELAPGSPWTASAVLQALAQVQAWETIVRDDEVELAAQLRASRDARRMRERLRHVVRNLEEVDHQLTVYMTNVPRSSSGVESLNSRFRVLQMVHRNVSDELLALHALAWNLTPRREGRRKGHSPFALLGIELGQGERSFQDVLLDAMAA